MAMFEEAWKYCENNFVDEIAWANSISPRTFKYLKLKHFLSEYCWVVYASGFKVSILEKIYPNLQAAFKDFDIEAINRMRSIQPVLDVFNNERKASNFLDGTKQIAKQGFTDYKRQLKEEGMDLLEKLPGIGPITKYHLAKNIGLVDEAKPDIWLVRAAEVCSSSVQELIFFLSKKYNISSHAIDVILWRYGTETSFKSWR